MKLVRYLSGSDPRPGVVIDDAIIPFASFATIRDLISAGSEGLRRVGDEVAAGRHPLQASEARLLAPIERPGKYLAIGMNYGKHRDEAAKLGIQSGAHQIWFNKQTTCLSGPYDDIDPGVTEKLDYEVELGVVIGRGAKHASTADAPRHVFGYFVANDVSARDWQFQSPTITLGKSFDTHGPIGPWIVTADEIPDPHSLDLRCLVNGKVRQASNTRHMIANVWDQIAHLSTAFTLEPGDLLATGTPEGVGVGMEPPQFLQAGDVVRCEVEGIGAIENRVVG